MRYILILLPFALAACSDTPTKYTIPPSHAELVAHESEILRLKLTTEAQKRLGIATIRVDEGSATASRPVSGEIVAPPIAAGGVPIGSLANLQQIGVQQAIADGEVARTAAQARLAKIAFTRADALVLEEAGSIRARDEAAAALAAADAALTASRQQRQLLGPPIAALNSQSTVWVRVSVFGSDIDAVQHSAQVMVQPLGEGGAQRTARPVQALPSADAAAGTVDLYYTLPNHDRTYRVGQRVAVDLPLGNRMKGLSVPSSAIVRDIHGGEWVYQKTAQDTYVRQRIAVTSEVNGQALLSQGLARGAEVVTAGAAELFGTEFGAAH